MSDLKEKSNEEDYFSNQVSLEDFIRKEEKYSNMKGSIQGKDPIRMMESALSAASYKPPSNEDYENGDWKKGAEQEESLGSNTTLRGNSASSLKYRRNGSLKSVDSGRPPSKNDLEEMPGKREGEEEGRRRDSMQTDVEDALSKGSRPHSGVSVGSLKGIKTESVAEDGNENDDNPRSPSNEEKTEVSSNGGEERPQSTKSTRSNSSRVSSPNRSQTSRNSSAKLSTAGVEISEEAYQSASVKYKETTGSRPSSSKESSAKSVSGSRPTSSKSIETSTQLVSGSRPTSSVEASPQSVSGSRPTSSKSIEASTQSNSGSRPTSLKSIETSAQSDSGSRPTSSKSIEASAQSDSGSRPTSSKSIETSTQLVSGSRPTSSKSVEASAQLDSGSRPTSSKSIEVSAQSDAGSRPTSSKSIEASAQLDSGSRPTSSKSIETSAQSDSGSRPISPKSLATSVKSGSRPPSGASKTSLPVDNSRGGSSKSNGSHKSNGSNNKEEERKGSPLDLGEDNDDAIIKEGAFKDDDNLKDSERNSGNEVEEPEISVSTAYQLGSTRIEDDEKDPSEGKADSQMSDTHKESSPRSESGGEANRSEGVADNDDLLPDEPDSMEAEALAAHDNQEPEESNQEASSPAQSLSVGDDEKLEFTVSAPESRRNSFSETKESGDFKPHLSLVGKSIPSNSLVYKKVHRGKTPYYLKNVRSTIHQTFTSNLNYDKLHLPRLRNDSKGDNDSGVDESTQNSGMSSSPKKSLSGSGGGGSRSPRGSPLKNRSGRTTLKPLAPRAARSKSVPKPLSSYGFGQVTPEPIKKVSMNKIKVGMSSSPNLKQIQSKIGSLEKAHHRPGGGNFRVESRKLEWNNSSRTNAYNKSYMPSGGDKKIEVQKLDWKAKSRIGSLENATHRPGGGSKKIQVHKVEWSAAPKVGSTDNVKHKPGGGNVKIINQKIDINVKQGKVGSLENVKHKPGGGERKVFNDVEYLRQMSEHSNMSSRTPSNTHLVKRRESVSSNRSSEDSGPIRQIMSSSNFALPLKKPSAKPNSYQSQITRKMSPMSSGF